MSHLQGPHRPMPTSLDQATRLHLQFLTRGLDVLVHWRGADSDELPERIRVWDEYSSTLIADDYESAIAWLAAFDAGEAVLS
jgi:hypothetical protein